MQIDPSQALTQFVGNLPTFIAIVLAWMHSNGRISDLNAKIDTRISDLSARMNDKFETLNTKIDKNFELTNLKMDSLNRSLSGDLHRVEEVMDARLKHLEAKED